MSECKNETLSEANSCCAPRLYTDLWLTRHERCLAFTGHTAFLEASDNWCHSTALCLAALSSSTPTAHSHTDAVTTNGLQVPLPSGPVMSLPSWVKNQHTQALITSLVIQVTQVSLQFYNYTGKSTKTVCTNKLVIAFLSESADPTSKCTVHCRQTCGRHHHQIITKHTNITNKTTQVNNCPRSLRMTS